MGRFFNFFLIAKRSINYNKPQEVAPYILAKYLCRIQFSHIHLCLKYAKGKKKLGQKSSACHVCVLEVPDRSKHCPSRCPSLMGSRGELTYTVCSVQFFQIRQALGSCDLCRKPCSALAHFHASSVDLGPPCLESCLRSHCSHSGESGLRLLSQALRRGENISWDPLPQRWEVRRALWPSNP